MQKRDNKHNSQDRRQENGMMLAELKHLKAQLAIKDKRLKELEEEVKELRGQVNVAAILDPNTPENKELAAVAAAQKA